MSHIIYCGLSLLLKCVTTRFCLYADYVCSYFLFRILCSLGTTQGNRHFRPALGASNKGNILFIAVFMLGVWIMAGMERWEIAACLHSSGILSFSGWTVVFKSRKLGAWKELYSMSFQNKTSLSFSLELCNTLTWLKPTLCIFLHHISLPAPRRPTTSPPHSSWICKLTLQKRRVRGPWPS